MKTLKKMLYYLGFFLFGIAGTITKLSLMIFPYFIPFMICIILLGNFIRLMNIHNEIIISIGVLVSIIGPIPVAIYITKKLKKNKFYSSLPKL